MSTETFDAFSRDTAAGVPGRGTLATLGAAGLAALLGGSLTAEAKKNKQKKRREKKKAQQKCTRQVVDCQTILTSLNATPEQLLCCQPLSTCDASQFVPCLFGP